MRTVKFDIKSALNEFEARTGIRLSYEELSDISGLSIDTIKSLSSRKNYNPTFEIIALIGNALNLNPIDYMSWEESNSE